MHLKMQRAFLMHTVPKPFEVVLGHRRLGERRHYVGTGSDQFNTSKLRVPLFVVV
jgi:hypothetical protein